MAEWQRKSRFLSTLMAYSTLRTRWERFLHRTWLGSRLTHFTVGDITETSFKAYNIPTDSPMRRTHPFFWGVRLSDEGSVRPNSYHSLVNAGLIRVCAPVRALGYSSDGKRIGVALNNGTVLPAKVVILATGYQSSWSKIFTPEVAEEIGIARHVPTHDLVDVWKYESLKNGPEAHKDSWKWTTSIYRGIVPARNIMKRDFAIAGALFTANFGYTNEVAAHWVSSYFQGDKMKIPETPEEATAISERQANWMRIRYPHMLSWVNESYSGSLDFWTWPQAVDEMLEDMYLPSQRSGGNWLTWLFRPIDLKEIENLAEERRIVRMGGVV
ncbi:hypothetical protein CC2G_013388 [Coprinopsis cinerea AmutBmut pab1-1]|nr:hypothetical protein CC2G_013388 [Coprinopsis cinerea AmutBmut pab1-1]